MNIKKAFHYIRFGCVFKELENYSSIIIKGSDSKSFLQNQLTINLEDLTDDSFKQAAILDNKGKINTCFYLCRNNLNEYQAVVKSNFKDSFLARLDQFLISEDVEFKLVEKKLFVIFGLLPTQYRGHQGRMFNESALITEVRPESIEELSPNDFEVFKLISGEPEMGLEVKADELFTNSFLTETALSLKKGCYPGQETVSKIMNNRGAAKFPVCLIAEEKPKSDELTVDDKKIASILRTVEFQGSFISYALVSREYRVNKMKFESKGINFEVNNFPLFSNTLADKIEDLYYSAIDEFQLGHDDVAVDMLKLCIELNPKFEDAYESLGVLYGRLGENHKAIELMHKLSELNPSSVMAHTNLSLYYMKVGEIKLAEDHKAQATLKQFEVLGEEAKEKKAKEQRELAEKEEEIRKEGMFKQVLEIDPVDALANLGLGEISLNRKDYLQAEMYLEQAIKTDKNYSVAYLTLAKTLKASGKIDKLKDVLVEGIRVSTKNGDLMPANEMQTIMNEIS